MATEIVNNKNNLSPWTSSKKEKSKSYKDTRNLRIFTYGDGTSRYSRGLWGGHNITPEKVVYQKDGIYKGTNLYKINGKWYNDSGEEVTKFRSHTSNAKPKQQQASGNSTGERKPAASNGRKPAAATAPRSNFSTPTPTYYTSLEKGITGYGLDPDLKKYLESLGVKSVKELLERLNTDLKSGLVVDDKWGSKTQDAFTAGYNAWKNQQQTERPQQQLFDYNQLFSQWDQWMRLNQQPRQQQRITAMPATYDRYDINHWLKTNGIKGITSKGKKALRLAANGEAYDTRYQGIVDLYLPMLRGNLGNALSTPTMDPRYAEYFQNLIGTSFNDLPAAYNNLRTKGNVDDMYAPEYSTFHKVYDWMKDNPDVFLLAKLNMDFAKNAVETYYLNNPLAQLPSISTPPYRVSTDTHTNPMLSNKLFLKVSDWANLNLNLKDYSSNNLGALFAKEGGYIPKFQNPAYPIWDMRNYLPSQNQTPNLPGSIALEKATTKRKNEEKRRKSSASKRKTKVSGARNMSEMNVIDLQDLLWLKGFFEGTGLTYDQAVDGKMGRLTRQAMERAKQAGYKETEIGKGVRRESPKPKETKSALEYAYGPGTTPSVVQELMSRIGETTPEQLGTIEIPIRTLTEEEAKLLYQNGTGNMDVYAGGIFHGIAPESWGMPHSEGLKDLIAAEIAYTEGLPSSKRERGVGTRDDQTYIGYGTHGKLSNKSGNVNEQDNDNNGTSKTMGGYRYKVNPDGSVDVEDNYSFNVVRDFSRQGASGQPYVYRNIEEDPYAGSPWSGLVHDVFTEGDGKSVLNIMENFFTRQGKVRKNNVHFEPGEINRRNTIIF